jgi:hypothetical protein
MASTLAPYYGPPRGGYRGQSNQGYGYGGQRGGSALASALMQIIQNKQQQTMAEPLPEAEGESYYESDYLAPYLEGLTPLGRFTDMGMRDRAAQANAMAAARTAATEKSRLQEILHNMRRTTNDAGQTVATTPLNATITTNMPAGPVAPGASMAPTAGSIDSIYGTGGIDAAPVPFTVGGLDGSEFFQRAANAQGANKYAQPEAGYRGKPLVAGSKDWNSWEKATSMIRKAKK